MSPTASTLTRRLAMQTCFRADHAGQHITNMKRHQTNSRSLATFLIAILSALSQPHELWAAKLVLVAGGGDKTNDGVLVTEAKLNTPFGVDFDQAGNLYFVELNGHRVGRVDLRGRFSTIAGTGVKGDSGDGGPALNAQFNGMHNLAISPTGDIFVADTWNSRVRKIEAGTHRISNIAGTGGRGFR